MGETVKERLQRAYRELHRAFLLNRHPRAFKKMQDEGTLEEHLKTRSGEAADMYLALEQQMKATAETMTDPKEKAGYLGGISRAVDEIVLQERVYVWP